MKNRKRIAAVLGLLLLLPGMAACEAVSQKVTAKKCTAEKCTITYSALDKNGKSIRDRTLKVSRATFEKCAIGEDWPKCERGSQPKDGMRNIPAPEDKNADKSNRTSREVCVQAASAPRVKITNGWRLGSRPDQQQTKDKMAFFQECAIVRVGEDVYLVSEHHTENSNLECRIIMRKGIKRIVLAEKFAYHLGDCKVQAVVK